MGEITLPLIFFDRVRFSLAGGVEVLGASPMSVISLVDPAPPARRFFFLP